AVGAKAGGKWQGMAARYGNTEIGAVGAAGRGGTVADVDVNGGELAARVQLRKSLVGIEHEGQLVVDIPLDVGAEFVVLNDRTVDLGLEVGRRAGLDKAGDGAVGRSDDILQAAGIEPD